MQKFYFFLLTFFLVTGVLAQRHDFAVGYGYNIPGKLMREGFNGSHNVLVDYRYSPKGIPALSMGASMQYGSYASRRQPQFFTYPDGSITQTTVLLTSSTASIAGTSRYVWRQRKKIRPFAELHVGWFAMYSSYFIENPHIIDGLSLDRATVHSDETYLLSAGAGLQFDLTGTDTKSRSKHSIELGVRSIRGGEVDFGNIRRIKPVSTATGVNPPANPRTITLPNIATTMQYQSSEMELYSSPLRMVQVHITYVYSLPVKRR